MATVTRGAIAHTPDELERAEPDRLLDRTALRRPARPAVAAHGQRGGQVVAVDPLRVPMGGEAKSIALWTVHL